MEFAGEIHQTQGEADQVPVGRRPGNRIRGRRLRERPRVADQRGLRGTGRQLVRASLEERHANFVEGPFDQRVREPAPQGVRAQSRLQQQQHQQDRGQLADGCEQRGRVQAETAASLEFPGEPAEIR